jgi:hypothetical protein
MSIRPGVFPGFFLRGSGQTFQVLKTWKVLCYPRLSILKRIFGFINLEGFLLNPEGLP